TPRGRGPMALPRWSTSAAWAAGAAGAALLFGLVQLLRPGLAPAALDLLLVAAALAAAALAAWAARRAPGRLRRDLAGQARALGDKPSPQALHDLAARGGADLAPVVEQLEALSSCYRNALAELVQAREEADQPRFPPDVADRARAAGSRPLGGTR